MRGLPKNTQFMAQVRFVNPALNSKSCPSHSGYSSLLHSAKEEHGSVDRNAELSKGFLPACSTVETFQ